MTDQTSARRLDRRALLGMGLSAAAWLTGCAVLGAHAERPLRAQSTAQSTAPASVISINAPASPAAPDLQASVYETTGPYPVRQSDITWTDATRQRTIPARVYRPEGAKRPPVVLYSHGLGGSLRAGEYWGRHWASHGIASIHLQHAGSDQQVFAGMTDRAAIFRRLQAAFTAENLLLRVADMSFVAAELAAGGEPGGALGIDASRIGAAGHSFGAATVQALAGQAYADQATVDLANVRFLGFVALSPSARGRDPATAFGKINRPFFSITGTADRTPGLADVEPENRLLPFANMPAGGKYLLVFAGGEHHMFGGSDQRFSGPSTPARLVAVTRATTTAFWLATLTGSDAARKWLDGPHLRDILGPEDRWTTK